MISAGPEFWLEFQVREGQPCVQPTCCCVIRGTGDTKLGWQKSVQVLQVLQSTRSYRLGSPTTAELCDLQGRGCVLLPEEWELLDAAQQRLYHEVMLDNLPWTASLGKTITPCPSLRAALLFGTAQLPVNWNPGSDTFPGS